MPPDPPAHQMGDMSYKEMARMMSMDDTASVGALSIDQFDWRHTDGESAYAWDVYAWYGSDYDKIWLKAEGERAGGSTHEARTELLWDRIFSRWWSVQTGVRADLGEGPNRGWLAFGVQGLAPWFFEVEATAYLGESGRTAARFSVEYDLLFTRNLILQPQIELQLHGRSDPANGIGSGLSTAELGLRLRYEFRREFAPYVGVLWSHRFGTTADLARAQGDDTSSLAWIAGVRSWW